MSRSRDWCYTLNNYTEVERDAARATECVYHVFGYERGEQGTPHLQGYIRFQTMKSLKQVKKVFERAHWEARKGPLNKAIEYCMKDGDFEEFGVKPLTQEQKGEAEKRRWSEAFASAKAGNFDDVPDDLRVRYYSTWKKIRADYLPKPEPLEQLANEWNWGPTGTGKTRDAWERYPDAFCKKANTHWWDGYDGEEVVIIDDFDKYHVKQGYEIKIWLDHRPFSAEFKGGSKMIRPKKFIITSNYHPSDIWEDDTTLQPVLRRVTVKEFGEPKPYGPYDCEGYFNKKGYRRYEEEKKTSKK